MAGVNWDDTEKVMEHQSCHTVTLTDDFIKNPMLFENKLYQVTTNKLYQVDPNDELYPLV